MKEIKINFDSNKKDPRLDIFSKILSEYKPTSFLDLATGHGKFALVARNIGFKVTAVDARPDRIPFSENGIKWIVSTVEDFDVTGFEIVNCLGLLYHLPLERQIRLINRLDCNTLIFDSHLANIGYIKDLGYEGKIYKEATRLGALKCALKSAFNNL